MTWTCACGVENPDKKNFCSGCDWSRELSEEFIRKREIGPFLEEGGLLKKGIYEKIVYIADPVNDTMAYLLIENDINVSISEQSKQYFHYYVIKKPDFEYEINIFYSSFFVGKYKCRFIKNFDKDKVYDKLSELFVKWFVSNAWENKF